MGDALGRRMGRPDGGLLLDIPAAIADIKRSGAGDLVIMGSGQLIRSLLPRGLIDEYLLLIHPIVLGSGRRLFEPGDHSIELRLVESTQTTTGVILATYDAQDSGQEPQPGLGHASGDTVAGADWP